MTGALRTVWESFTDRSGELCGPFGRTLRVVIMSVILWIGIYLCVVNVLGFIMMGVDKNKARRRAWRIPEAHLFIIAIIGGSLGTTMGMHVFRHKTKHWYFLFGMPAILIIQVALVVILYLSPLQITLF